VLRLLAASASCTNLVGKYQVREVNRHILKHLLLIGPSGLLLIRFDQCCLVTDFFIITM